MAQDLGGGSKGQGGALADSVDSLPSNPTTNRSQADYTPPLDRGLAAALVLVTEETTETAAGAQQYQIIAESDDVITASPFENDTAEVPAEVIAKPPTLRKSLFDGKTILNELFEYESGVTNARKVTNQVTGDIRFETITPAYTTGELLYAAESSNGTELTTTDLIDLNVAGRRFIEDSPQRFQLQTVNAETLTCRRIFSDDSIDTVDVEIARCHEFRTSTFDAQTVDDVTYVYSDASNRVATDSTGAEDIVENQLIIPPYRVGSFKDEIWAERVSDTGIPTTKWLEKNNAGRHWQMDALDTPAP